MITNDDVKILKNDEYKVYNENIIKIANEITNNIINKVDKNQYKIETTNWGLFKLNYVTFYVGFFCCDLYDNSDGNRFKTIFYNSKTHENDIIKAVKKNLTKLNYHNVKIKKTSEYGDDYKVSILV